MFLAMASHNTQLGDWILEQLLKLNKPPPHSKMVLEIILSDPLNSYRRIIKLLEFVYFILTNPLKINSNLHFAEIFFPAVRTIAMDP